MKALKLLGVACGTFVATTAVGTGIVCLDRLVSRPSRIEYVRQVDCMIEVWDALLRHEYERGGLPAVLQDLVPRYVQATQIESGGKPLYRYDVNRRTLAMAEGMTIRGLVPRRWPPHALVLPEPPPRPRAPVAETRTEPAPPVIVPPPVKPAPPEYVAARTAPPLTRPVLPPPKPAPPAAAAKVAAPPRDTGPHPAGIVPITAEWNPMKFENGLLIPRGAEPGPAPEGVLVFEAEHFSELNYGWEAHPDEETGGGAYIHCKEGTTAGSSQAECGMFDFWNIQEKPDYTVLKYHFRINRPAMYWLYGRIWATAFHCSNSINVGLDKGGLIPGRGKEYYGDFMGSGAPFRWMWRHVGHRAVWLDAGDHYVQVFPHEDGVRLDQFMLIPEDCLRRMRWTGAYPANLFPARDTAFEKSDGAPVSLTFDLKSAIITENLKPECRLVIRRIRPSPGKGWVQAVLRGAGKNGVDVEVGKREIEPAALPELAFMELDFSGLDFKTLPRREYLLTAEFVRDGSRLAENHVPLVHPFAWEVTGDFGYLRNDQPGPLDGDRDRTSDPPLPWRPFVETCFDCHGIMDFGLLTAGNSVHAPALRTLYARTTIRVPETETYVVKLESDDQMLLWVDGKPAYRHDRERPVTRSGARVPLRLEKGTHQIKIRVNNGPMVPKLEGGSWQAQLRFRTKDDLLSGITGAEPPEDTQAKAE